VCVKTGKISIQNVSGEYDDLLLSLQFTYWSLLWRGDFCIPNAFL